MNYLSNLNKEQLEATKHINGPCLVLAGAGSGKTRVLTSRIAFLIEQGINPNNILAITFTNKAAKEMKERVESIVGQTYSFIGTFHSFGLKIIRENYEKLGLTKNFTIIDADDSLSIIKKILKSMNIDSKAISPSYVKKRISYIKNNIVNNKQILDQMDNKIEKIIAEVYKSYEDTLYKCNAVDFDDLLLKSVQLLLNNKDVINHYNDHYPYILVDEYQDTNAIQYMLCKLLTRKNNNIFVVGDMNQSIYGFRQADYRNILNFERDFYNTKIIKLEQNYRSTKVILEAANNVIKNNKKAKHLKLWSDRKDDNLINYIRAYDEKHEIKLIGEEINKLYKKYNNYNSFAILYRTNAQSRVIEEILLSMQIPYKIYGGLNYLNRKEIKDLIAYLKLVNNSYDEISLKRIINVPKRGIGKKAIEKIEEKSVLENKSMFECLSTSKEIEFKDIILKIKKYLEENTLTKTIDYIIEITGIKEELEKENTIESQLRLDNILEFKSLTISYEKRTGSNDLNKFLEEVSLLTGVDENKTSNSVSLMTLHSAKGLEFDVVFLVGMEENIFPHINSMNNNDELEEERRLCYVGITRAKDILYLTNAKKRTLFGKQDINPPSRFIKEIDKSLIKELTNIKEDKIIKKEEMYSKNNNEFKIGDIIKHELFGNGVIISIDKDIIDVAFKSGIKKLNKNHKSITKSEGK